MNARARCDTLKKGDRIRDEHDAVWRVASRRRERNKHGDAVRWCLRREDGLVLWFSTEEMSRFFAGPPGHSG